ncbi:hypothetical protein [Pseudarthrobacter polychromogenes]|uniref:Uncharacterized protein n=1 Tax=Pseudarthrobacter polychromogenes TaxID=1676 RepID=A0ABQ1X961_9MICC|nr:hypothetical protein [Pseudarthrobacter polychromogenes]GGG83637.1 hypothetical protein GCM10011577_01360 [Pseudarthrobacter polychromogenes]
MSEQVYDGGTPDSEFSTTDGVIDYATAAGKVRLYITDTDDTPANRLFTDAQLTVFLNMNADNVYRASAQALRVIAASEVLTSKVIRTQDRATDGAKVSAELRALADQYDAKANADDAAAAEGFFDVVPFGDAAKPEGAEWRY